MPSRKAPVKWSVQVTGAKRYGYRTMFFVGVQGFELARHQYDPKDPDFDPNEPAKAKHHCEFIKKQFLVALGHLGVKREKKPCRKRSKSSMSK